MELEQVRERVAPTAPAHERTLPVLAELSDLFPESALVRGRVLSCVGPAAISLALATSAAAMQAGSWMVVVDVPTIGLDAAGELGVPLQRVVRVTSTDWAATVVAAIDGFDLVITAVPGEGTGLRRSVATMLASRIRRRGAVVLTIGATGELACDGTLRTDSPRWEGLAAGHGRLCRRRVDIRSGGRRIPGERGGPLLLPGDHGRPQAVGAPDVALVS
jgi:hypothetical protein